MIKSVKKRDGKVVSFDKSRIETAIRSAMARTDEGIDDELTHKIADSVENILIIKKQNRTLMSW